MQFVDAGGRRRLRGARGRFRGQSGVPRSRATRARLVGQQLRYSQRLLQRGCIAKKKKMYCAVEGAEPARRGTRA